MKPNRRSFLGLLGIGAVSAPLAAKAAADAEIANLTGLRRTSLLAAGRSSESYGIPMTAADGCINPYIRAHSFIKTWGKLPDFVEDNVRERAKTVHYLDPDIACKRSWSMNAKIQEQRKRNFEYELSRYEYTGKYELAQSAFSKLTGWQWPW